MFAGIYFTVWVLFIAFIWWSAKSGKPGRFFEAHPRLRKALVLGYIVYAGCFAFPIRSDPFPLDLQGLYMLMACYGVMALTLVVAFGPGRKRQVYLMTLSLTAVGMCCRYLLEFGEVSNTYNFTLPNIVSYIVIIPICTTVAYGWIERKYKI